MDTASLLIKAMASECRDLIREWSKPDLNLPGERSSGRRAQQQGPGDGQAAGPHLPLPSVAIPMAGHQSSVASTMSPAESSSAVAPPSRW